MYCNARDDLVGTASFRLMNGCLFNNQDKYHVLAVLAQRLCIEPVFSSTEAVELTDRSIADHMKLLIGTSYNRRRLYAYSPSEPALVLGTASIIYKDRWAPILDTFSKQLCEAGLVEKGFVGELAARTLLIIAHDYTAPDLDPGRNLLALVCLLDFLDQLFGNKLWCTAEDRARFESAFCGTYVNFTHWIVTKDSRPEVPDLSVIFFS